MHTIEYTLTSIEVAEMVNKNHCDLLRDIRCYIANLNESRIAFIDFFSESTYVDSRKREKPCYNITKKGCEFIAHKMTGVKGTAFTARYINRFHEMEQQLQQENHMDWFVNDVRVFQHREFGILRTLKLDGKDYFIGKDATISLGYVNNTDTLKKRVSDSEKCYVGINDGNRTRRMVAITTKGLNQLIKTGKLPVANKYNSWIQKQVLPALAGTEIVPVNTRTEKLPEALPGTAAPVKKSTLHVKHPLPVFKALLQLAEDNGVRVDTYDFESNATSLINGNSVGIRNGLSFNQVVCELAYSLAHRSLHANDGNVIGSAISNARAERAAQMMIDALDLAV